MIKALFIRSRNRLRSPTAEQVFAKWPNVETDSAGLSPDAELHLSSEQIAWADIIFVMEKSHRSKLNQAFRKHLGGKRVICLDIPDDYGYMQPELVQLLEAKAGRFLRCYDLVAIGLHFPVYNCDALEPAFSRSNDHRTHLLVRWMRQIGITCGGISEINREPMRPSTLQAFRTRVRPERYGSDSLDFGLQRLQGRNDARQAVPHPHQPGTCTAQHA